MKHTYTPIIDEWPVFSFQELENIKIDWAPARFLFKVLIRIIDLPETILHALFHIHTKSLEKNEILTNFQRDAIRQKNKKDADFSLEEISIFRHNTSFFS